MLYKALIELGFNKEEFKLFDRGNGIEIIWNTDKEKPTDEEIQAKIKELEAEEVKNEIEKRADEFIKKQLKELDYNDMGEVALYAGNEKSEWHDEAVALQKWVEDVYKKMYELQESITTDNYKDIDLDEIEAKYPPFKA